MLGSSSSFLQSFTNLGSGYIIALALGFLALLSTLLLTSYFCYRGSFQNPNPNRNPNPNPNNNIARVIFVAEDDESSAPGLDQAVINSYSKFPFASAGETAGDGVCSICLCEYKEGEMLRMMPDCSHYFHLLCIDAWLRLNASCPVCRTSPMPTPLSTPLSELVPLSHFVGDRRRR